ncbi:UNVERIFIED_CONTAM: hypothetical protein Sradi_2082300 [Sesamum radiatum]|uniref:Uncharacterized protein n=1 Tax=Sesamum radiatum TaxID=300843 RepID=A0AAW2TIN4_SESRA
MSVGGLLTKEVVRLMRRVQPLYSGSKPPSDGGETAGERRLEKQQPRLFGVSDFVLQLTKMAEIGPVRLAAMRGIQWW